MTMHICTSDISLKSIRQRAP